MARKKNELQQELPPELVIPKAFVSRVTTNLKAPGEKPRDVELGPLTLLVGPSGSGKTSLVDAMSLALCGESPTRGLGKAAVNLKRALPEKADALTATVLLSTGEPITWSLARSESKPVWSCADGYALAGSGVSLPSAGAAISVSAALDLLLGYDKNRLLATLDAVPHTEITVDGVERASAGMYPDLGVRLEGVLPADGSKILPTQLRSALSTVDSIDDEFAKAAKACELLQSTPQGYGLSNTEQIELDALERAFAMQSATELVQRELTRAEAQVQFAQRDFDDMKKLIEEACPGYFTNTEVIQRAVELLATTRRRMVERGEASARCPGCGEVHPEGFFAAREMKLTDAAAGIVEERQLQGWLDQLEASGDKLRSMAPRMSVLPDLLTQLGAASSGVDTSRLVELRQRKGEALLSTVAASKLATLANGRKVLGQLRDALMRSAASGIAYAADHVQRRMNRVLPKGRASHIVCEVPEEGAVRIHIGQSLNKGPIVPTGALSGSERIVFAAAFALALQGSRKTPVSLMVIDETMFDRRTLKTVLTGLCKAFDADAGPTQIIVCTSEWTGKAPAGWIVREIAEAASPQDEPQIEGAEPVADSAAAAPSSGEAATEAPETPETAAAAPVEPPAARSFDDLL